MTTTLDPTPLPAADRRPRRSTDLVLIGGALPLVLFALARSTRFAEGDTYWQIVAGAEILDRGTTRLVEDDSWTAAGTPWHPNSWLYDVVLQLVHRQGGWAGLGWFTVLVVSTFALVVTVVGRRLGAGAPALAATSTVVVLMGGAWLSARPQTASYCLLVVVVAVAARAVAGRGGRAATRSAVGLTLLTALWVNLHLAALAGLVAVAGGCALTLLDGPVRAVLAGRAAPGALAVPAARALTLVGGVGLGCLLSPLGTGILASASHTAGESVAMITEWAPLWEAPQLAVTSWVAAVGCLVVLVLAWRRTARAGRTPTWLVFWVGAVAPLVAGGVTAARFSGLAVLLALPATAAVLHQLRPADPSRLLRRLAVTVPAALGVTVLVQAATGWQDFGRPGPLFPEESTVAAIPDGCRVLNEYDEGGLITLLRGDDGVLVSVDGRNDLYGEGRIRWTAELAQGGDGALTTLAAQGVGCLLLAPDRPLVADAAAAGWRVAARDDVRVLLVAPPAGSG